MRIGSAVGRNRAINFKRLWIDAFLGCLATLLKPRHAEVRLFGLHFDAFWISLGRVRCDVVSLRP